MPWGMFTQTTQIVNLLTRNNTTTATIDISGGMTERIKLIQRGKYDVTPIPMTQYPCVLVRATGKDPDEFEHLGSCNNKRQQYANFEIVPIVQQRNHNTSEGDHYKAASNIEALFRSKISLSSTVNDAMVNGVEYDAEATSEEFHNTFSIIGLRAHKLSD